MVILIPRFFHAGEKLKVYAQARDKRKSEPAYITVLAPTAVTAQPVVTKVVYEYDREIYGTSDGDSDIIVRRADGTILGLSKNFGPSSKKIFLDVS
ncbi:hypothetical protein ACFTAO_49485 [Paenibacillus rhizoplanae]